MAKKIVKSDLNFELFFIFEKQDDLDDEEIISGDYYNYAMFMNGEFVKTFGDWYHDKANAVAKGYMEGYSAGSGKTFESNEESLVVFDAYSHKDIIAAYKKFKKKEIT